MFKKMTQNMHNERSLCVTLIWYLIFCVSILFNSVFTDTGSRTECNEGIFKKNGSHSLSLKEECNVYNIVLDFEKNTSIINLTASIQYVGAESSKNRIDSEGNFHITVHEAAKFTDKGKVLLEEWGENLTVTSIEKNYLSRSSKVFISVSGTGNWTYYNITFSFHEIMYRVLQVNSSNNFALVDYCPNSVSLLSLYEKPKGMGIEIIFHNLNIISEKGEYLLIGTGIAPFKEKDSRPLFITQVANNSKFYVDNPTAFIAFVSGSTRKTAKTYKIEWSYVGVNTLPDEKEDPLGKLNSSLICFYNVAATEQEFIKKDGIYETFRQSFTEYLREEFKDHTLEKNSVKLFGKRTEKKDGSGSTVALGVLIKVVRSGKSIFTWRDLQNIIGKFELQDNATLFGYKVGKCPQDRELPRKDEWSFVMYAMVPVFGLFALMMWAWKQNIFAQKCMPEKEEKLTFGHTPAEPNPYVTRAIPKVYRTNDDGRRETLVPSSSQQDERTDAGEITIVEMNTIPPIPQEPDTLTRFLSSRKSKARPSLKSLINTTEEHNVQSHDSTTEGNGSEHLYDSVSSSKQLNETKL